MKVRAFLADIVIKGFARQKNPAEFKVDGFFLLDLEGTGQALVKGWDKGKEDEKSRQRQSIKKPPAVKPGLGFWPLSQQSSPRRPCCC
jgi:hypothetical protein